jgi:hypothetical protein
MTHGALAITAMTLAAGVTVAAHHSLTLYDRQRTVSIDGTVRRFEFINPHPVLTVEVRDAAGRTQPWRLELDNRFELASAGITSDTLKPGDRVVITGNPARAEPTSMYLRTLDRPADGFRLDQINSGPRVRLPAR